MHRDSITIGLRLPGLEVLGVKERRDCIEVVACAAGGGISDYSNQEAICPRCGRSTWQVHQWHRQRKRDAKLWGKPVWLLLWKRRFRCRVCRKVFTESDPACGPCRRTTRRLRREAAKQAQEASVRAVARWQGVSEGLVQRSWQDAYPPPARHGPPRYLGEEGKPLTAVAGEGQRDLRAALEALARPEVVQACAMDLHEPYRQAVELVALAQRALRDVRQGRRQRGNLPWLLDRGVERLKAEDKQCLVAELARQPQLAEAWGLKEGLRSLYGSVTKEEAVAGLDTWLEAARDSGLPPFQRLAGTLTRWREEVLNYWRFPITNALVEGKHNRLKVLKRRAYGYRNHRTFLLRACPERSEGFLNLIHTD